MTLQPVSVFLHSWPSWFSPFLSWKKKSYNRDLEFFEDQYLLDKNWGQCFVTSEKHSVKSLGVVVDLWGFSLLMNTSFLRATGGQSDCNRDPVYSEGYLGSGIGGKSEPGDAVCTARAVWGCVTDRSQRWRRETVELEGAMPNEFITPDWNTLEHNLRENGVERLYELKILAQGNMHRKHIVAAKLNLNVERINMEFCDIYEGQGSFQGNFGSHLLLCQPGASPESSGGLVGVKSFSQRVYFWVESVTSNDHTPVTCSSPLLNPCLKK